MIIQKPIIVAVSGGFDPIHIGSIRLFQNAKKLGDKLVVILNNDNWLKAKKRHIFMAEKERQEVLEALACVDRVVLTNHYKNPKDMSVCKALLQLRPNIFANGGDRHKKNIPEVATCDMIGCRMVFNVGKGGKVQSSSWLLEEYMSKAKLCEQTKRLYSRKKVFIFDLDGTLTKSKAVLDKEMAALLCKLLKEKTVAIIGGGNYAQFKNQFLNHFNCAEAQLKNLFILPVSGGSFYEHRTNKWQVVYKHALIVKEKTKIFNAFKKSFRDINYVSPKKTFGEIMEDRESQITFSALGQKAPLDKKKEWNTKSDIRPKLQIALQKYLPQFEIRLGGLTSIDITKKGIDKAYGIAQIMKLLSFAKKEIIYIGDALYKGGNDYVVKRAGVATIKVKSSEETKVFIDCLLEKL